MALGTRFKLSQTGLQFVQDACAGRARGAAAGTAPVWEIFALRRLHRFPGPSLGCHGRNGVLPREGPRGGPSYPLKPHCASSVGRVVAPARTQGPQRVVRRGIDVGVGVLATTQPHHQAEHHAVVAVQYLVQVSVAVLSVGAIAPAHLSSNVRESTFRTVRRLRKRAVYWHFLRRSCPKETVIWRRLFDLR